MAGRKGQIYEAEVQPYTDEATEFQVYRLTDPASANSLPFPYNRIISRNSTTLLFYSERTGSPQAFRMNLKSAETQQLTERPDLDGESLNLLPDGRSFAYFAGNTLVVQSLENLRERPVYTVPSGWERSPGLHIGADGLHALFPERSGKGCRLQRVTLTHGAAQTILQTQTGISFPVVRPQYAQILYRESEKALRLTAADGSKNEAVALADGGIGPAYWSVDGKELVYLNFPHDTTQLNAIRAYSPDSRADKLIAKTSQYVAFGSNRDHSVFVGASRNAGSPAILIMLRVTRKELTLCEHRASRPEAVSPLFSPDAQRIYFQSDRHGKPAIYSLHVERLVERIGDQ